MQPYDVDTHLISPDLYWVDIDGVIYLLDLAKEKFFALEPEFAEPWKALAKLGVQTSRTDQELVKHACENGWLVASDKKGGEAPKSSAVAVPTGIVTRLPAVLSAWFCLLWTSRALRKYGMARMHSTLRTEGLNSDVDSLSRQDAEVAFRKAERFYLDRRGKDDCLPRSLAIYIFFRLRTDLAVEHHIGVERYPFGAHAWCTVKNEPIFDTEERISNLSRLVSF